jgi:hypothetical protein
MDTLAAGPLRPDPRRRPADKVPDDEDFRLASILLRRRSPPDLAPREQRQKSARRPKPPVSSPIVPAKSTYEGDPGAVSDGSEGSWVGLWGGRAWDMTPLSFYNRIIMCY